MLDSAFSDVYCFSHKATPIENRVLEPAGEDEGEREHAVKTRVDSLLPPKVLVLKNGDQFCDCHQSWQNEEEGVETASTRDPRHYNVSRNTPV